MGEVRGVVKEIEGVLNLVGREMLSCMRAGTWACVMVMMLMVVVEVVCLESYSCLS